MVPLTQLLTSLFHWTTARYPSGVTWHHVYSHQGDPFNEAADSACWFARHKLVYAIDLWPSFQLLTFDGSDLKSHQWLWTLDDPTSLPFNHRDGVQLRFNLVTPTADLPDAESLSMAASQKTSHRHIESDGVIKCLTANVMTLYPRGEGTGTALTARAEALAQQFHDTKAALIGLQECRSKKAGYCHLQHYHVLSAAATQQGQGGAQLWVAKEIQLGDVNILVQTQHMKIVHADPQRLFVKLTFGGLRLFVLVLHVPNGGDDAQLESWWKATDDHIPPWAHSWTWIVLMDANSRIGSVQSTAIGDHGADPENLHGQWLHSWLLQNGLCIPQTFENCHSGQHSTWCHPNGARARIDFIAVSHDIPLRDTRTCVELDCDLSLTKEDHDAVAAYIPFRVQKSCRRRAPVADPGPGFLHSPWRVNVHTHAAVIQRFVRAHFSTPGVAKPRKQHMSHHTWSLIRAKHWTRNRIRKLQATLRSTMLRAIFDTWNSCVHNETYPRHDVDAFRPWMVRLHRELNLCVSFFRDTSRQVTHCMRQDDRQFFNEISC
eukprot:Skav228871  [mRNA]  locus=scaffold816:377719:379356:+ [translate_table: standard]